mgnify:CR=1 FL=1
MSLITSLLSVFDLHTENRIFNKLTEILNGKANNVIDVGAHKGEFIIKLSKNIKLTNAISFEPNPEIFKILNLKTSSLQKKGILKIFNLGAGVKNTNEILNVNIESSSSSINNLNTNSQYFIRKNKILNFFNNKKITKPVKIEIINLGNFVKKLDILNIDLLKIDTEGYEFNTLQGTQDILKNIKVVHFEHHFDDMIIKNYKLSDIHNLLVDNKFKKYFKIKMKFRKSFEYIYYNTNLIDL